MIKKIIKVPSLPKEIKAILRHLAGSHPPQFNKLFRYVSKCMIWAYRNGYRDSENEPKPVKVKKK